MPIETAHAVAPAAGKLRLIEGAIACVADHGISDATVRRIAEYADVTPGLVRHHFGSKDELLAESYRHLNTTALRGMRKASAVPGETFANALSRVLLAFFPEDLRDIRAMRVLVAFWGAVLTDARFAEVQKETNTAILSFLTEFLETHLGPREDTDALADAILALMDGFWLECCLNPTRMTPESALKTAHLFCAAALNQRR